MTEKEFIEQIALGTLVENDIIAYAKTVDNKQSLVDHIFELQYGYSVYGLFCSNFTDAELARLYDAEEILCSRFQLSPWEETEAASQKQLDLDNGSQPVFVDPQPRVPLDQIDQIAEHVTDRLLSKMRTAKEHKQSSTDPDRNDHFLSRDKSNDNRCFMESVFKRLKEANYLSDKTERDQWMIVCGLYDGDMKPIVWNGSQTQLTYLVWQLFQRDNPDNYWAITGNCFVLRDGSRPNLNSMKNNPGKVNKQKWIKEFDYIMGKITLEEYNKSKEI